MIEQNRSASDMTLIQNSDQQHSKRIISSQRKLQTEKNSKLTSYRNQNNSSNNNELESQQSVSQGNIATVKAQSKKQGLSNIKSMLKNQQISKNLNLSQSINSAQFVT